MAWDARTAVLVLVPGAEPLMDRVRGICPDLVRPLPAHVSLLYPGPAATPSVLADIESMSGELPEEIELSELVTGEEGFVGVAAPALDPLLARARKRFPDIVPYGGRFGTAPSAHLTLAMGASDAQAHAVLRAAEAGLPCRGHLRGPVFVQRTPDGWRPARSTNAGER